MNYVLDTNILVHILTGSKIGMEVNSKTQESHPYLIISIVTKAEIISLAKQRSWGNKKMSQLYSLLEKLLVIPIDNDEIVEVYAELDAYSQDKLKDKPLGLTSRNMGKNDLWIAATTYLTKAILLTTDKDFDHLQSEYISVESLS